MGRAQGRVDRFLTDYTFNQLEVRTSYGKDGRQKETRRRLFHYFSGEKPGEATRELVEIDGRPATVAGEEEDPLVGPRRLSDLIARFDYRLEGAVEEEGRLLYALEFSPKPGLTATSLGDRALNALAGRVLVDASNFQIVSVEARLVRPFKVGGGLAANVKGATISYRGARLRHGIWFPCVIDLHLEGKTAVFFRLDTSFRFEFSAFASFSVETDSEVGDRQAPSVQSAR